MATRPHCRLSGDVHHVLITAVLASVIYRWHADSGTGRMFVPKERDKTVRYSTPAICSWLQVLQGLQFGFSQLSFLRAAPSPPLHPDIMT